MPDGAPPLSNAEGVVFLFTQAMVSTIDPIDLAGVQRSVRLGRAVLQKRRAEVEAMLGALPDEFMDDGGGGWSFLNMCMNRRGEQWTGLHENCERLLFLGLGLELAAFTLPRELWSGLHGGMPYLTVKRSQFTGGADA